LLTIIVDEVPLGAAAAQQRWRGHSPDLASCGSASAAMATSPPCEIARADRVPGPARWQAGVHHGVSYGLELDTARAEPIECARIIAAHITRAHPPPRAQSDFSHLCGPPKPPTARRWCS
jgi:chloramphenicol 3-O phosphotransferase